MKVKAFLLILVTNFIFLNAQEKNIFDLARAGTVTEMQEFVKKNPATLESVNAMGFTPLILACYRGNVEVAKFLIDNVKDVNYQSPEGTALAGLCIRYNRDLVEALLKNKADPNIADSNGTTPLIWAVKAGNEELIKILLQHGAKKDQPDLSGVTPFEYAVTSKKENIINLLKTNAL